MKHLFLLFAVLMLSRTVLAIEPGEPAPEFELLDAQGKTVRLSDYRGKTVYLDFWASWCVPCRVSFPWMNDLHSKYAAKGVEVIAVSVDKKRADADRFISAQSPRFVVLFDESGTSPKSFKVPSMPSSYLIGPDGKVISVHSGFKDSTAEEIESEIAKVTGATI